MKRNTLNNVYMVNYLVIPYLHTFWGTLAYWLLLWIFYAFIRGFVLDLDIAYACNCLEREPENLNNATTPLINRVDNLERTTESMAKDQHNLGAQALADENARRIEQIEARINNPSCLRRWEMCGGTSAVIGICGFILGCFRND